MRRQRAPARSSSGRWRGEAFSYGCWKAWRSCSTPLRARRAPFTLEHGSEASGTVYWPIWRSPVLSNVGPGLGFGGNFQGVNDIAKWLLSLGMLLGRLELLSVLVLLSPTFWRA